MNSEPEKLPVTPAGTIKELEETLTAAIVRIRQLEDQLGYRRRDVAEMFCQHDADMEAVLSQIDSMKSEGDVPKASALLVVRETLCDIYQRMSHAARNEAQYLMLRCEMLELDAEFNKQRPYGI